MVARNTHNNRPVVHPTPAAASTQDIPTHLGVASPPTHSAPSEFRLRPVSMPTTESCRPDQSSSHVDAVALQHDTTPTTLELLQAQRRANMDNSRFDDVDYVNALLHAVRERAVAVSRVRARVMAIRAENAKRAAALAAAEKNNTRRPPHQGGKTPPNGPAVPALGGNKSTGLEKNRQPSPAPSSATKPHSVPAGQTVSTRSGPSSQQKPWLSPSRPAPCNSPVAASSCSATAAVAASTVAAMSCAPIPISSFKPVSAGDRITSTGKDISLATGESAPRFD